MDFLCTLAMDVFSESIDGYADGEEVIVFHHKNGEFREKEPRVYSDLATGKNQPKRGLFRSLVNTRSNRLMFFTVLLCFALVMGVNLLQKEPSDTSINGARFALSAFSFDQTVFVSVAVDAKKATEKMTVKAEFFALDSSGQVSESEVSECEVSPQEDEQFLRATFSDFDLKTVRCVLTSGQEKRELTSTVQHK